MFKRYFFFTTTLREILNQVEEQDILKKSKPIRSNPRKQNRTKYYQFHKDYSYDTEDCFKLKKEIKNLIR